MKKRRLKTKKSECNCEDVVGPILVLAVIVGLLAISNVLGRDYANARASDTAFKCYKETWNVEATAYTAGDMYRCIERQAR